MATFVKSGQRKTFWLERRGKMREKTHYACFSLFRLQMLNIIRNMHKAIAMKMWTLLENFFSILERYAIGKEGFIVKVQSNQKSEKNEKIFLNSYLDDGQVCTLRQAWNRHFEATY